METLNHEQYELIVQYELDGTFKACFIDLPGSDFRGSVGEDVYTKSGQAFKLWVEKAALFGIVPPEPGSHRNLNGVIRIRIARSLHRQIGEIATSRNVSISALVTAMLFASSVWLFDDDAIPKVPDILLETRPGKREDEFTGQWIQKIPLNLHSHLLLMANKENLSISALTQYLLGRMVWITLPSKI